MEPPVPLDEAERLRDLYSLPLLDRPTDENFDRLTRLVAEAIEVPMAVVSFVDARRQWFASRVGVDAVETDRDQAFCAYTIAQATPLVVEDATADRRFADNPLVVDRPKIRFYAGVALAGPTGRSLGSLCAIDTKPRRLEPPRVNILTELGRVMEREIGHLHRANSDPLTGFSTRGVLVSGGARLLANDRAAGRSTSVLIVGVDRLAPINRRWGYAAGDEAITQTAEALRRSTRSTDLLARLPGAKMAAVLPDTGPTEMGALARDIEGAMGRPHQRPGAEVRVGGVAVGAGERLADALVRAELVASASP